MKCGIRCRERIIMRFHVRGLKFCTSGSILGSEPSVVLQRNLSSLCGIKNCTISLSAVQESSAEAYSFGKGARGELLVMYGKLDWLWLYFCRVNVWMCVGVLSVRVF